MFTKILLATDGSNHAYRALAIAANMAHQYDAELVIVHVLMHGKVPEGFRRMLEVENIGKTGKQRNKDTSNLQANLMAAMSSIEPELAEQEYFSLVADHIITSSKKIAVEAGVEKPDSRIVSGDVAESILRVAEHDNVDLIVIGTRGIGPLNRLFLGSVASKISQLAQCPCLTVR